MNTQRWDVIESELEVLEARIDELHEERRKLWDEHREEIRTKLDVIGNGNTVRFTWDDGEESSLVTLTRHGSIAGFYRYGESSCREYRFDYDSLRDVQAV
jgi:hypothetical protein